MKNKIYSVAHRSSYTLFILEKNQDVEEYLKYNYPQKINSQNYCVIKTTNNKLCFVFKSKNDINEKINPTLYAVNRCKNYTGKVLLQNLEYNEVLEFEKGKLVKTYFDESKETNNVKVLNVSRYDASAKDIIYIQTPKQKIIKYVIFFLSFLLGCIIFAKISNYYVQAKLKEKQVQEKELKEQQELLNKKKQLADKAQGLKNEYYDLIKAQYLDVYEIITIITRNLESNSKIENLSIERNTFEIDLYTKDSLKVLNNFETDPYISEIKMNRSIVDGSKEYVVYSGIISQLGEIKNDDKTPEEQIAYYEKAIQDLKKDNELLLSEYITQIRDLLNKTNCSELYISIKANGDYLIVELSVEANKTNLFQFLKMNLDSKQRKIIRTARIKSKTNQKLQAVLLFDTRIKTESLRKETQINLQNLSNILPAELSVKFGSDRIKTSEAKPQVRNNSTVIKTPYEAKTSAPVQSAVKKPSITSLIYIGKGGTSMQDKYIFVKEKKDEQVFKLKYKQIDDRKGDYYFEDENGKYKAYYKGNYVEVVNVK